MPAPLTLSILKGDAITVTGTHQVSARDATAVDISGWTLAFTVRKAYGDAAPILQKSVTVTNGPAGQYSVSLTTSDTALAAGEYFADVARTDSGSERVLAEGKLTIQPTAIKGQ